MVLALIVESPLLRGVILTVIGVGFWVGGLVVANYFWKRYRGSEGE